MYQSGVAFSNSLATGRLEPGTDVYSVKKMINNDRAETKRQNIVSYALKRCFISSGYGDRVLILHVCIPGKRLDHHTRLL